MLRGVRRVSVRLVPWLARLAWTALPLVPGALVGDGVLGLAAWLAWGVTTLSTWVAHPVTLTVCRVLGPASATAVLAGAADRPFDTWGVVAGALLAVGLLATFSAEFGARHAQAGAYGAERRHLLRPPVALLAPTAIAWLLMVAPAAAGVALAEAGRAPAGVALLGLAVVATWRLAPRLHRLSRRWLVRVPAGWVVHDDVVLAENLLLRTPDVTSVGRAHTGTDALDLTGLAAGGALQVTLRRPLDVRVTPLAVRLLRLGSDALHVSSFLVAPTRLGPVVDETA
jgi:hypothetical protein